MSDFLKNFTKDKVNIEVSKKEENKERQLLLTENEFKERNKIKNRKIRNEHVAKYKPVYNEEKRKIDKLSLNGLLDYLSNCEQNDMNYPRVGLTTVSFNYYEQALIKAALDISNSRSLREFIVLHCSEIVNNERDNNR